MDPNMEDLRCIRFEVCGGIVPFQGTRGATLARARARDWHIFEGHTLGGKYVTVILCWACVGSPRSRLPRPSAVLEGQEPMF
jgi:hypothetical protein